MTQSDRRTYRINKELESMAHNLAKTNGSTAMAYYGETPWHALGTRLDELATASEAILTACLEEKSVHSCGNTEYSGHFLTLWHRSNFATHLLAQMRLPGETGSN